MRALGCALGMLVLMGLAAGPAGAAFPGRDGLLAVQPYAGPGLLVMNAHGGQQRRICTDSTRCGFPRNPRWSPDGRSLSFNAANVHVIYPDGSCLDCQLRGGGTPAFTASPQLVTFVSGGQLAEDGVDGIYKKTILARAFSDAVWSARGELAAVSAGRLWVGTPSHLRSLGAGASPSWSPDSSRLAIDHKGWVRVVTVSTGSVRRLVPGYNPAWSPDGSSIAFIGPRHELEIVAASGGRPRPVGRVRAYAVDWQPRPPAGTSVCVPPPGSKVLASSADAVVTSDANDWSTAVMGCLLADGRERFLERLDDRTGESASGLSAAGVGDGYAALANESLNLHYGGSTTTVAVFDLRTGAQVPGRGGEEVFCERPGNGCGAGIDQVVVGAGGVSAALTSSSAAPGSGSTPLLDVTCPSPTLCLAVDPVGRLFTSTNPAGGTWTMTSLPGLTAVSCPSVSLCVGAAGQYVFTATDPTGGASAWTVARVDPGSRLTSISCPSTTLCVATDIADNVWTSSNPAAGAAEWTHATVDATVGFGPITCPSTSFCVAVDGRGNAVTSSDPTGGAAAWQVHAITTIGSGITALSCPSTSLCVGLAGNGIAVTWNPTTSQVSSSMSLPGAPSAVTCPSTSLCLTVGEQGTLDVSTDPGASTWTSTVIDNAQQLLSIGCASTSVCVAGDRGGNLAASSDPTGGAATWAATLVDGNPCSAEAWCTTETIAADDASGLHTLDTLTASVPATTAVAPPAPPTDLLTALNLSGSLLTWDHAGTPKAAVLQP